MSKINVEKITTEDRNMETIKIDLVSTVEAMKMINDQDKKIAHVVETQIPKIAEIVDIGSETIKGGGRIIYFGAGTSGRLGVLDASEMLPTFGEGSWFQGIISGGNIALTTPVENAEDSKELIIQDLKKIGANKKDLFIGIAASGRTPYVLSGLEYAKKISAKSASISTSANAKISKMSDIFVEAVTGAETITGSTRMKSGTAQKLILNMISSGIMIKMGKTYSNWMVDVKPTNEKLIQRAINMISNLTNTSHDEAKKLFYESNKSVKTAFVMHNQNLSRSKAVKLIKKNEGKLRNIIK